MAKGVRVAEEIGSPSSNSQESARQLDSAGSRRAAYEEMDASLSDRETDGAIYTSFFGAAADVNGRTALGSIDSFAASDFLNANILERGTEEILEVLGQVLFAYNLDNYNTLAGGSEIRGLEGLRGASLDFAMVGFEQTIVQGFLGNYVGSPQVSEALGVRRYPTPSSLVADLNDSFNSARARVLHSTIREIDPFARTFLDAFPNRDFDFATFDHRARLGLLSVISARRRRGL